MNRFLWSYEGQRIISYVIEANGSLTGASTTALADNGRALAVDSQGEYIYLGIGSSGVRSYQIDPVTGKPSNAGSLYGSAPNALVVSPTSDRLFGAPSDFGDKV